MTGGDATGLTDVIKFTTFSFMGNSITATEANRSFSRLLRAVERGEKFTITSHGRAIATLGPADSDEARRNRQASLAEHLKLLRKLKPTTVEPWSRAELYERD